MTRPEQAAWIGIPRSQWAALGLDFETRLVSTAIGRMVRSKSWRAAVPADPLSRPHPGHVVLFEAKSGRSLLAMCCLRGRLAGRLARRITEQLLDSIMNKLLPLGDDVEVYSGREVTTIGQERKTNPSHGMYKLDRGGCRDLSADYADLQISSGDSGATFPRAD